MTKPDQLAYEYFYYKGNAASGYKIKDEALNSFNTAFTRVLDSVSTPYSSVSNLWPGYKMSFCVKVTTAASFSLTLQNSAVTKGISGTRFLFNQDAEHSTDPIDLARAIRIYADVYTSDNYGNFYSKFLNGKTSAGADLANVYEYSKISNNAISLSTAASTLVNQAAAASSTVYYLFYTVEFSNDPTTWYREVSDAGADVEVPVDDSGNNPPNRYFVYDTSAGDSNCYAGLSFAISTLVLG